MGINVSVDVYSLSCSSFDFHSWKFSDVFTTHTALVAVLSQFAYSIYWSRAGAYLKNMNVSFFVSRSLSLSVVSRSYLFIGNRRLAPITYNALARTFFSSSLRGFAQNIREWREHIHEWLWFRFVAHEIINIFEFKNLNKTRFIQKRTCASAYTYKLTSFLLILLSRMSTENVFSEVQGPHFFSAWKWNVNISDGSPFY